MKYDLEDRFTRFAVMIIDVAESLPRTRVGNHLAGQLIRSGTSPALNYGEAQSAESRRDFVHKFKVILKELRETNVSLSILQLKKLSRNGEKVLNAADECRQLIAIIRKSITTAETRAE